TWRSPPFLRSLKTAVNAITADRDGRVWFLDAMALHVANRESHEEFQFPARFAPGLSSATALFAAKNGGMLIEANGALYGFQKAKGFFEITDPGKESERFAIVGALADGRL